MSLDLRVLTSQKTREKEENPDLFVLSAEARNARELDANFRPFRAPTLVRWPTADLFPLSSSNSSNSGAEHSTLASKKGFSLELCAKKHAKRRENASKSASSSPDAPDGDLGGRLDADGVVLRGFGPLRGVALSNLREIDFSHCGIAVLCASTAYCAALPVLVSLRLGANSMLTALAVERMAAALPQTVQQDEIQHGQEETQDGHGKPLASVAGLAFRVSQSPTPVASGVLPWLFALPKRLEVLDLSDNDGNGGAGGVWDASSSSFLSPQSGSPDSTPDATTADASVVAEDDSATDSTLLRRWTSFSSRLGASTLRDLDLSRNPSLVRPDVANGTPLPHGASLRALLGAAVRSGVLERLTLRGCRLSSAVVDSICCGSPEDGPASTWHALSELDLGENRLTRLPSAAFFGRAPSLRVLLADANPLADDHARGLARSLRGRGFEPSLARLDVDSAVVSSVLEPCLCVGFASVAVDRVAAVAQPATSNTGRNMLPPVPRETHFLERPADDLECLLGDVPALNHSADLDEEMENLRTHSKSFTPVVVAPGMPTPNTLFAARSAALGQLDGRYAHSAQRPSWSGEVDGRPGDDDPGDNDNWDRYLGASPIRDLSRQHVAAADPAELLSDDPDLGRRKMAPEKRRQRLARLSRLRESRVRSEIAAPQDWVVRDRERFFGGNGGEAGAGAPSRAVAEFDSGSESDDSDSSGPERATDRLSLIPARVVGERFLLGFIRRPGSPGVVPPASAEFHAVQRFLDMITPGSQVTLSRCERDGASRLHRPSNGLSSPSEELRVVLGSRAAFSADPHASPALASLTSAQGSYDATICVVGGVLAGDEKDSPMDTLSPCYFVAFEVHDSEVA
jgi:hypothetical protein